TACRTDCSSWTSSRSTRISTPASAASACSASALLRLRIDACTRAPVFASCTAACIPTPDEHPVIKTTFCCKSISSSRQTLHQLVPSLRLLKYDCSAVQVTRMAGGSMERGRGSNRGRGAAVAAGPAGPGTSKKKNKLTATAWEEARALVWKHRYRLAL